MRRQRSIRRIAGALRNRAVRRALTTWAGWATAEREYRLFKRNSVEMMLRRWRQQGLAEAFAAWAGARAEQRRVRHIKARVLALLTHRQLARAWGALWHHRCTTLQLKRVVAIWGHRPLVSAFGRWWEWLEERRRKLLAEGDVEGALLNWLTFRCLLRPGGALGVRVRDLVFPTIEEIRQGCLLRSR